MDLPRGWLTHTTKTSSSSRAKRAFRWKVHSKLPRELQLDLFVAFQFLVVLCVCLLIFFDVCVYVLYSASVGLKILKCLNEQKMRDSERKDTTIPNHGVTLTLLGTHISHPKACEDDFPTLVPSVVYQTQILLR